MDILYLLIPLSLVLVFVIAIFFWWSLRNNQYDDLDGPGYRILMDDDRNPSDVRVLMLTRLSRPRQRRKALRCKTERDLTKINADSDAINHNGHGFYGMDSGLVPEGSLLGLGVRAAHPFFSPEFNGLVKILTWQSKAMAR
jgi:cbb3-type cytochrome oxidase maturation protein